MSTSSNRNSPAQPAKAPLRRALLLSPLLFALCAALPLRAQVDHRADAAALQAYTLNLDNLSRLLQAGAEIDKAAASDPVLKKQADEHDRLDNKTLDQLAAEVAASPRMSAIATAHGFSAHEFCVAEMVYLQTVMIVASIASGAKREELLATPGFNPANLIFFEQHRPEIDALIQKETPDSSLAK